jgi:hypothetical protein
MPSILVILPSYTRFLGRALYSLPILDLYSSKLDLIHRQPEVVVAQKYGRNARNRVGLFHSCPTEGCDAYHIVNASNTTSQQ